MPEIIEFRYNTEGSDPKYLEIIKSMRGRCPLDCRFVLVFNIERSKFRWTGRCKCTGRSVPKCRPCQFGTSFRNDAQIDSLVDKIKKDAQKSFDVKIQNINTFFLACKDFAIFLSSSSMVLVKIQGDIFGRKNKALSFDLESNLKNYMIDITNKRNPLSQAGKNVGFELCSDIFPYVRMPTSSGSICPDFANNPIRIELLTLSISIKVLFRFASLTHLNNNHYIQKTLMRQIAKYSLTKSFRRQIMR
jgi:hypothetical protein